MKDNCITILKQLAFGMILLVLSAVWNMLQAQGQIANSIERATLQAIYDDTSGDEWTENYRWTQGQIDSYPDSALYGIEINNGDITSISLSSIGLNGTLPEEINDLTAIEYLNVSNNNLIGTIPDLRDLQQLKTLNLNYNGFSGTFPSYIGNLVALERLYLSNINMIGPLPTSYGQLINLEYLDIQRTNLSAAESIPGTFSNLDKLQTLNLSNCQLNINSVSTGLSGLNLLQTLFLSNNPLLHNTEGLLPDILVDLPNLSHLYLNNTGIEKLPASFDNLQILSFLSLADNNYASTNILNNIIDTLQYNSGLKTLIINSCNLSGLPSNFYLLSALENLYLNDNDNLQAIEWEIIGQMPVLKTLFVENSSLTDLPDYLVNISTLTELHLRNNNLDPIPEHIKNIPNLNWLDLSFNGIQSLPSWFGTANMNSIQKLTLNNNGLELPLPSSFANLINLGDINLSNNKLDGALPSYFSTFTNIYSLNLSHNKLRSPLPDLSSWTFLDDLYLQNNEFTGTIPEYLSDMGMVGNTLNISYNQFDSVSRFDASSLLKLYINNNKLHFSHFVPPPALGSFVYAPQDTVDTEGTQRVYVGDHVELQALIDTATAPLCYFQWFQYMEGAPDSAMTAPQEGGDTFVFENISSVYDGAQFYYKITNNTATQLTLVSRLQTLEVRCDIFPDTINFTAKRYLCAMNFNPFFEIVQPCKAASYLWNFGDGITATDRSAWHAYSNEGTYNVTLHLQYQCGSCTGDTTINKQIEFSLPESVIKDSLIQVDTDIKSHVLNASASTFSDVWPISFNNEELNARDAYLNGSLGVWRNESSFVYDTIRELSASTNIAEDGTFALEQFNRQYAYAEGIPQWIRTNTVTRYSPYSYELENKDVLGIYSAALYDYGGHLASANGVNMRHDEMAYTGFEYLENKSSGNWSFNNQAIPAYSLFNIRSAIGHMAVVDASIAELENVEKVDVIARRLFNQYIYGYAKYANHISDNEIICIEPYPSNPNLSLIVFKRAPFEGFWRGTMKVNNELAPATFPLIDSTYGHSGRKSLKITGNVNYAQKLLRLDSGKSYLISLWASVNNMQLPTPFLAEGLGLKVIFKNNAGDILDSAFFTPEGKIIEGWQLIKGTLLCPAENAFLELDFNSGNATVAWFDDLRLHPESGNMKSYVYNLKDYRLQAILDEENYASFFYYDNEGNLYLTKKETERGVKSIAENISYTQRTSDE